MSNKSLLPGNSNFCGFDVHGAKELAYRKLINDHTKHINETKIISITNIHTSDWETVLKQKRNGSSLREAYLKSNTIVLEPSNLRVKFHFLSQDQKQLDYFINSQLYPKLMELKPEEPPRILNRGLCKEDYSDDNEECLKALIASTEIIESTINLKSSSPINKFYSQAAQSMKPSSTSNKQAKTVSLYRNKP